MDNCSDNQQLTHNNTINMAEAVANTMTTQIPSSHAASDPFGNMIATLDKRLVAGLTSPEDKTAIEKALGTLTRTHSVLGNRVKEWEANGQRVQALLQRLNSELQKLRDVEGVLLHDIQRHRAFISSLARRITTQSQEDVAAPLLPGSIKMEARQMERFTMINQLAVAGENYARMNLNQGKLKSVGSKLSVQIAEAKKTAKDISEKQRAERATEILMGKDLERRMRRAEELGCRIESARMAENVLVLEEELGVEYWETPNQ